MLSRRLSRLRERLAKLGLDALVVTNMPNVFYLTGFTGSTAAVVVSAEDSFILVDPRYSLQARSQCRESEVRDYTGRSTIAAAGDLLSELAPAKAGYEADDLAVNELRELRKTTSSSTRLRSTSGVVETLRRLKDAVEVAAIKAACAIVDKAFTAVVDQIRPGVTEKELALLIDSTMRGLGADKEGFDTIAASGPNSACPHASPTDRAIQRGDFVKMDFGARLSMYNSDITRTVCAGSPDSKHREVYQTVLDAQLLAIEAIRPGLPGKRIDTVARDYIASKGYGDNFGHGLGHALGIECHDGPALSQTSKIVLEPGMVVTVEPGIYIEGWGGVRIEDDVVITESGCEVLTSAPKQLMVVGV